MYSKIEDRIKEESMPLTIVNVEKDPYYRRGIKRGIERGRREGMEHGLKQGIERGIERGKIETARRMYEEGIKDIVFISRITGIGVDRLREILRV